jgi:hypothetical protein
VTFEDGSVASPPDGWELLPPGDAGLTRRVKAAGPSWTVVEWRKRRPYSQGVWAPKVHIDGARADLDAERDTPAYQKRQLAAADKRERVQGTYVEDFRRAVLDFLHFPVRHVATAVALAEAVTAHATPVGRGTVARTQRIAVDQRAEAAVIAWMRHQTTAYDHLTIPRQKGQRRQVRAMLAAESRRLLQAYRRGEDVDGELCPLQRALRSPSQGP